MSDNTEAVRQVVVDLLDADEIGVTAAGRILAAATGVYHPAHPDENAADEDDIVGQAEWRDADGTVWPLERPAQYVDAQGRIWRWSGGFEFIPRPGGDDNQPLMSLSDWSERDVPLVYVRLVAGPLHRKTDQ